MLIFLCIPCAHTHFKAEGFDLTHFKAEGFDLLWFYALWSDFL
jgi:hypothetical protein